MPFRKYRQNETEFADIFNAAKCGDTDKLIEYAQNGGSLNVIDTEGITLFCNYCIALLEKEEYNLEDVETLISLGANPALYGVSQSFYAPIGEAATSADLKMTELFLNLGVSPNYYLFLDEMCDDLETLIDLIDEKAYDEDFKAEEPHCDHLKLVFNMLEPYLPKE